MHTPYTVHRKHQYKANLQNQIKAKIKLKPPTNQHKPKVELKHHTPSWMGTKTKSKYLSSASHPNTYRSLLTPNPLQKTITPTETNNNTSHSHHHNWAKFQHLFGFHRSILDLSEMTPKQAKNSTLDLRRRHLNHPNNLELDANFWSWSKSVRPARIQKTNLKLVNMWNNSASRTNLLDNNPIANYPN